MSTSGRLRLCGWLCLLPTAPLAARLGWLQLVRHDAFEARVGHSVERQDLTIVPRGRILDRDGRPLAQSLPAWSVFLDVKVLREMEEPAGEVLDRIADALGMARAETRRLAKTERRTVWLKRKIPLDEARRLRMLELPCVGLQADELRSYPNGALARTLLGEVNHEGRGAAGLELAFDKEITGRAVPVRLRRDGAGRSISRGRNEEPVQAPDLTLTIERPVQFFAEEALDDAMEKHHASAGTIIIQDPATGEVLALATRPGDPRRNPAVQDVYEPGSTFKAVVAAAALEDGTLKPGEAIDCENGRWQLSGAVAIKDHEKQGRLVLADIIKHSSNIGSGKLGLRLGAKEFFRFCRLFGFGYKTGVPLPGESQGMLSDGKVDDVRLANAAFGQGVAVTALQLSAAYAAIANGGTLHEPRLVRAVGPGPAAMPVVVRRVASPGTVAALREMLVGVVEGGTGVSAAVPGYSSAGKTGTAQKVDPSTGKYSATDYVASFVGWVPAAQPRWSILVVIDSPRGGYYGAEVAAPVFSRVARELLALKGVPPERPLSVRGRAAAPAAAKATDGTPKSPAPLKPSFLPAPRPLPRARMPAAPAVILAETPDAA